MASRLTFGYLYDFRNPPQWHKPWDTLYGEILDVIAWSEEAGFGGAWVPEHHLADDSYMPSPMVALAAIAARTRSIRIGSAVAIAPLYDPVRFATDCAVLDTIAGGRTEMSVAIGYRRREAEAFGIDFSKRGRMFDEWLEIVSRLGAGETVDFDGQFYRIRGARVMPPAPGGRIPLYVGGFADRAIERVIGYGEGYIGSEDVCLAYVDKLSERGMDTSAAKVRITGILNVVAEDPEAAMEELAPYYHHVNNTYGEWFAEGRVHEEGRGLTSMPLEEFKRSGILQIWTPDEAIGIIKDLQRRMPLDHYMFAMPPGLPAARFIEYANVVATKVLPAFA